MDGVAEVSLCFDYKEIKHIIIPTLDEYRQLVENIDLWELLFLTSRRGCLIITQVKQKFI
jgi:hypothetical protein